ncbi:MAG TPA: deoxynucleoside kinase [bacterium]|nr:deoxynucleoside kinase [Myxococcales bacterium]OQA61667.1 MAG: Deoxyadenosine/deoxycytidine kinase [bacterium ADurb.Bin270]HPW45503.1 deoxynucleoside kinase [bacterium]HQC50285.1 deoxynucleoside kinase [bacterium]HQG13343.1 deoxynucleoside kinase [bacterium]
MTRKYIAIAGNMGSGKSSLVDFLCKHFALKPFFEYNDFNPFLPLFYKDMKRWAFHSQMHFLTHKFRIHRELDSCPDTVVQDRSIYEDAEIFAFNLFKQGCMSKDEWRTYCDLYETMISAIKPPDLLIYLNCPIKTLKKRIARRGRAIEKNVPDEYIKRLERYYKRWLSKYDKSPVLELSTERMDYIEDFIHRQDLMKSISKHL